MSGSLIYSFILAGAVLAIVFGGLVYQNRIDRRIERIHEHWKHEFSTHTDKLRRETRSVNTVMLTLIEKLLENPDDPYRSMLNNARDRLLQVQVQLRAGVKYDQMMSYNYMRQLLLLSELVNCGAVDMKDAKQVFVCIRPF